MTPTDKDRSRYASRPVTAANLIAPWPNADRLDRAIQDIAKRWLARSLLVTIAGCASGHERESATPQERTTQAAYAPIAPRVEMPADAATAPGAGMFADAALSADAAPLSVDAMISSGPVDPLAPLAPGLPAAGSGFDPIDCSAKAWDPMPRVKASQPFDYAALRVFNPYADPQLMTPSHAGIVCATATDKTACSTTLDQVPSPLPMNECGQAGCIAYYVSTTLGDTVTQWSTREELLAFLGPIDSPEDALLVAYYDGYHLGHSLTDVCDTAAVRKVEGGYEIYATRLGNWCTVTHDRFLLKISKNGELTELRSALASQENACIGRRPAGLLAEDVSSSSELGAFFARHAHLEAASVYAFERMITELIAHRAPSELVAEARAARNDEVRHAALVGALAGKHGVAVPDVRVHAPAQRSLLAMAVENASEGCVRESWGALIGTYQAGRTRDRGLATVFAQIARDERRHATLSWRVAAWLDTRLTHAERAHVATAYRNAIITLREEETWPKSAVVSRAVGLPDRVTALALLDELDEIVWAAA